MTGQPPLTKMVIGNAAMEAADRESFAVTNPATGRLISRVPRGRAADISIATDAAAAALPQWRDTPPPVRAARLHALADLLDRERESLAMLLCQETGHAIRTQARPEIGAAIDLLRYFAGAAHEVKGQTVPLAPGIFNYTLREPFGVVGAMTPWNAPAQLAVVKAAMAIVTGNTLVLKASEEAPLTVLRIAELAQHALPPGVLNVVTGYGAEAGAALLVEPRIAKLSFTGSTSVGRLVMAAAAERIVPVSLELGGKGPVIVFPDSDDEDTAHGVIAGMRFFRQGQSCTAGSRLYVHDAIYDSFVDRLKRQLAKLVVGDPSNEETDMGSLINESQLQTVSAYVRSAIAAGAEVLYGEEPGPPSQDGPGYFMRPWLLGGVDHDAPASCEEIFGPVLIVNRWSDLDDVIRLCNDSVYGLAGYVWTRDLNLAMSTSRRLAAGWVQINRGLGQLPGMSYGGIKASGIGREFSIEGAIDAFTYPKTVTLAYDQAHTL